MKISHCPECKKKVAEEVTFCPHCGFSFSPDSIAAFNEKMARLRAHKQEVNRKSAKLQLVWLVIFVVVILLASWLTN
ncbi:zinc-ribbon domain-containing protein [Pasteurellaceae bacterium 20609_3]|uniref:zinc ribbon domain-containing protein n=1 Tax=Spirabiliibacterium mucosae TaxID=28156 RepID=UPI001AAC46BE|nr:zinc ribbon domain-containing protein [Spirabiliibacterium mucosae]MBE2898586.1 zinc-ribbon domain-containing protein [Spirabiliibacterium mucosae]